MAELIDALDSKSNENFHKGLNPFFGTKLKN